MTKRKLQAIQTKQKLLDAAAMLVNESGFDAVTVDDIVAACGVAKGTFYHYFESKTDLLVYLTRTPYEELNRRFDATDGLPYLERLRLFIQEWFNMVEKYNFHFTVLHNRMIMMEQLGQKESENHSQIEQGLSILCSCLTGAVCNGELSADTPVDSLCMAIIFSMQGSAMYQIQNVETFDVPSWAKTFAHFVFDIFLKPYRIS